MKPTAAATLPFSAPDLPYAFLRNLKKIIESSEHSHEQTAHGLLCELEELADSRMVSEEELAVIIGKAMDILAYFRYDFNLLSQEGGEYRACVIHQMCCGMLQTMSLLRLDFQTFNMLNESAYELYSDTISSPQNAPSPRPLTCRHW